jgi:hypothetical protein
MESLRFFALMATGRAIENWLVNEVVSQVGREPTEPSRLFA